MKRPILKNAEPLLYGFILIVAASGLMFGKLLWLVNLPGKGFFSR